MEDVSIIFFLMALAIAVTILHTFLKQAGRDRIRLFSRHCWTGCGPGTSIAPIAGIV